MAKKIWYSKTLVYFWEKYHKYYAQLGLDSESLYIQIKRDINSNYPFRLMPDDNRRETLGTDLWYTDYKEEMTHLFFIDKDLKSFLGDLKLADLDGIKQFLMMNGEEKRAVIIGTKKEEDIIFYQFALHVPYEKEGFAFSLGLDQESKLTLLVCSGGRISLIPEEHYQRICSSKDKIERSVAFAFRLSVNLLAYMSCFPECISDGVPSNLPDKYESRSLKTITFSDRIADAASRKANSGRVSPHFRKGYFRLLTSDFYSHKKGQLVFVHETMVNGKAKTVYTSDRLSEFEQQSVKTGNSPS